MMIGRVFILMFAYEIRFFHYTPIDDMEEGGVLSPPVETVLGENINVNRGDIT
jgi:hypothetical protein